jgi:Spy/CpxP family protein refolding chaperone
MQTKKWKMMGAVAAALVLGGVVAVSCAHGGHGKMTPERMKTIVSWKVNDVLDDIDATSAQRKAVLDATYKVLADFGKLHAQSEADHEKLLAELESSQPRADVFHAMIDERTEAFKAFLHRSVDTMLTANSVLTPEQREQLVAMAREHMQKD